MENKIISKNELSEIIQKACENGMEIQRTINDKYDIPATRIKKYIGSIIQKQFEDKKSNNFICQQCKNRY